MSKIVLLLPSVWLLLSVGSGSCQQVKDESWDFLILAQFWPGTSCVHFEKDGCTVPPGVKGWTIHGLWPSRNPTGYPEFCDKSMPFNYSQIQNLSQQLDKYWPHYNKSGNRWDLWEHEWEKHGTCAYVLPSLQGQLNYFSATLQLHSHLDIFGTLSNAGIVPDHTLHYDLNNVFNAVKTAYGNIPQIVCFYSDGKYYLGQVWLCFDKTLSLTDCPQVDHKRSATMTQSLKFESEGSHHPNYRIHALQSPHNYFVGCPINNSVVYTPIPGQQVA